MIDNYMQSTIEKIIVERNKTVDNAILGEIQQIAVENGIETKIILNEKAIVNALQKQIPKRPIFYDTKFRQRGQRYGELVTIERAYNCPNCNCTVWGTDKDTNCHHCGQALDWGDEK